MSDLDEARRVAVERLMTHLAQDHLTLEDFEARVAAARAASSRDALDRILVDLPGRGGGR